MSWANVGFPSPKYTRSESLNAVERQQRMENVVSRESRSRGGRTRRTSWLRTLRRVAPLRERRGALFSFPISLPWRCRERAARWLLRRRKKSLFFPRDASARRTKRDTRVKNRIIREKAVGFQRCARERESTSSRRDAARVAALLTTTRALALARGRAEKGNPRLPRGR